MEAFPPVNSLQRTTTGSPACKLPTPRPGTSSSSSSSEGVMGMTTPPRQEPSAAESLVASLIAMGVSYAVLFVAWRLSKSACRAWDEFLGHASGATRRAASAAYRMLEQRNNGRAPALTEHERVLTSSVVDPSGFCTLADVGGLDEVVQEIGDLVVLPLSRPELFATGGKLVRAPRGVLLYGPPGCGKTMLARAVANDANAALLDVRASTLSDKYYGETNKLVRAVFSLASKLAPCVIFFDEVDGFLSARTSRDADVTLSLKAEFMSSLDGLLTDRADRGVVVLAATNRPYALDTAVLRRFARQFQISLPDVTARRRILKILLSHYSLASDVDLDHVARVTEHYSGADLEEVCRAAATRPVRELARHLRDRDQKSRHDPGRPKKNGTNSTKHSLPRPISFDDFRDALRRVAPTGADASAYRLDSALATEVD